MDLRTARNAGVYRDPALDRVTLESQYRRWWQIAEHSGLAPNTLAQYENVGRIHVLAELGSQRLASMRRIDLDEWITRLVKKGLSASTIRTARTIAGLVMESALDAGIVSSNLVRGLKVPRQVVPAKRALTAEQVELLAVHMPEHYRALVLVLAYGGLRPSEAMALRRRHLDDFGQLMVEETLTETGGRLIERQTTKTGTSRVVPLPPTVTTALRDHIGLVEGDGPEDRIFRTVTGCQIRLSNFRRDLTKARLKAGLPEWVTPYTLRHTAASLLAKGGVGVHAAAQMLGHDPAIYLRTYAHHYPQDLRSAASALDGLRATANGADVDHTSHSEAERGSIGTTECAENVGIPMDPTSRITSAGS